MKQNLWIQMNENRTEANEWPHDYRVDLTTGVNWFIHVTDQNGIMNNEEIESKEGEKEERKGRQKMLTISSCTQNYSDKILISTGITPYIWENSSIHFVQNYKNLLDFLIFKQIALHFNQVKLKLITLKGVWSELNGPKLHPFSSDKLPALFQNRVGPNNILGGNIFT